MPQPPLHANAQLEHLALLAVIDAAPAPDRAHEPGGEAPPAEESDKEGAGASPLDRAGLIALLQSHGVTELTPAQSVGAGAGGARATAGEGGPRKASRALFPQT